MPLLAEIQRQAWWKQFIYQKQLWEYEIGGELDLKTVTGYFGEEAILAFYGVKVNSHFSLSQKSVGLKS